MRRQYHSTPRDCLCSASLSFEWRRECILTSTFLSKENAIRKWSGTARTLDVLMGINDAVALIGPAINCNGDRNFRKRSLSLGSYKPRYRGRVQCAWDLFTGTVLFNQLLGNSWRILCPVLAQTSYRLTFKRLKRWCYRLRFKRSHIM